KKLTAPMMPKNATKSLMLVGPPYGRSVTRIRPGSVQVRTDELVRLFGDVDRVLLERIELDRHPARVLVRLEGVEDGLVVHRALPRRQVEVDAVGRDVLEMEV